MTVKKNVAETIYFSVLMIFIGGMMDGYSYVVRGGVFANGQTGNFIKLGLGVVNLDRTLFVKSIVPIIGFWLGIFAAEHLFHVILKEPDREIRDVRWKRYILWAEMVLLLVVGLIPGSTINLVPNSLISFTAALQYCCFRKL
ncbi:MAG: YoaK family protein, partial [Erysipelotrichaceae bacterium]|nr:YoaK family protein [Erysipelotrichaceae bacterium]